jgi:glycosyltransferase involved in cell wall biosynthesis
VTARPRILLIGSFAEPEPVGSNRTLALQAISLRRLGLPVEILTWPLEHTWRGPRPGLEDGRLAGRPYLHIERQGLSYHVVSLPKIWSERVLNEEEWDAAVAWGVRALSVLRPQIVHQQFWQNLWWMMEAAIKLGIPIIYSVHDYGIACLRTILVTGWNTLCDGVVSVEKCSSCILAGRSLLGKINEWMARLPLADSLLPLAFGKNADGPLARAGGLRMPVQRRVSLAIERSNYIFSQLDALIVASPFAENFFSQFGTPPQKIHTIPWFHAQEILLPNLLESFDVLRLGVVSRISPEKGLHILLEALGKLNTHKPIILKIAGSTDSRYAQNLMHRFTKHANSHQVIWCGWIPNEKLHEFYADIQVVVIPSIWYDNTPLVLVEALAQGRPVICTDVPSMTHLVKHEVNGLVFPIGDVGSLAQQIDRLAESPELICEFAQHTRNVLSTIEYANRLNTIYETVLFNKRN